MTLELSREELEDLRSMLEGYLSEFHDEIVHTDRRELRTQLHATFDRMEQLKRRVDALIAEPSRPNAHGPAPH